MQLKSILIVLIIGAVYLHETEGTKILAKAALVKAKIAAVKAPHIIAKVAVAKEVKAKAKIAAVKTFAAAKATKIAALSALTAPFRVAKKTILLKIAGVKALKALKVAKIAKTAAILKNLKKSPIILPVPVAIPFKSLPVPVPIPIGKPALPALPSLPNLLPSLPSFGDSSNPLQGVISGAQKAIQSAGSGIPFLSTLTQSFGSAEPKVVKEVTPAPVYRFVPEVGFTNYNKVSYQPQVEVEVPSVVYSAPAPVYGPPVVPVAPIVPASTYGVPN